MSTPRRSGTRRPQPRRATYLLQEPVEGALQREGKLVLREVEGGESGAQVIGVDTAEEQGGAHPSRGNSIAMGAGEAYMGALTIDNDRPLKALKDSVAACDIVADGLDVQQTSIEPARVLE